MPMPGPAANAEALLAQIRLRPWATTYAQLELAALALGFVPVMAPGLTLRWFAYENSQFPLPGQTAGIAPVGLVREVLTILEEAL